MLQRLLLLQLLKAVTYSRLDTDTMDPITIISALTSLAPIVTKWLDAGKTVQEVAEKASEIAKIVTGKDDAETAVAAIQASPELQVQFQTAVMAQDLEYEKLYTADKADSRKRDIALSSTPTGNVRANWLVAAALVIISAILVVILMNNNLSEFQQGIISMVLGMFLNELKNIYSFEFGTTRRSREKTDIMSGLTADKGN